MDHREDRVRIFIEDGKVVIEPKIGWSIFMLNQNQNINS